MELKAKKPASVKDANDNPNAKSTNDAIIKEIDSVEFKTSPKKVALWLTIITLALNFLGLVGRGVEYLLGIEETTEIVRLVHVAEEGNLTTWFSALLLLFSSLLLAITAKGNHMKSKPYVKHWAALSVIFFLMSLDEAARIHELTIEPLQSFFNTTGIFHYAWVLLAIPFLIFLGIFYANFLRDLPNRSRLLIIIAGIFYVISAMGMDMIVGYFISYDIAPRLLEPILITVEELGENLAIVLFIYALLSHLKKNEMISEINFKLS